MQRRRKRNAGMTLIEVMFAAGVVAMALAILFGSLISISLIGRLNQGQMAATTALSTVMEELRTLSYAELLEYTPPELTGLGIEHVVTVECLLGGEGEGEGAGTTVALPLPEDFTGTLPNPVEIRVTLTWREETGHAYEMVASTVRGQ